MPLQEKRSWNILLWKFNTGLPMSSSAIGSRVQVTVLTSAETDRFHNVNSCVGSVYCTRRTNVYYTEQLSLRNH